MACPLVYYFVVIGLANTGVSCGRGTNTRKHRLSTAVLETIFLSDTTRHSVSTAVYSTDTHLKRYYKKHGTFAGAMVYIKPNRNKEPAGVDSPLSCRGTRKWR